MTEPRILLVPVDGSEGANAAAAYAGNMAERLGISVRLLFAFPRTALDMFGVIAEIPNSPELRYFSPDAFEKLRNETAKATFAAARKAMSGCSVEIVEHQLVGDPAPAIVEHTADVPGGMIVIGRRGLSHFKEVMLGSVTQRVLHKANCPVLVIR